jgi:UDP-glucose:(heptosyl)LPS alpha-1,3-glucosyltransferase
VKLAIVRQRYDPSGSAERFVARMLPALERAGAEVTLIAREAQGWGARRLLRVDPFHVGRRWSEASFARAARAAWLREGFDFVQSHEAIPGCHVYRPDDDPSPSARKETLEHPRLRAVLCHSKKQREELRRAFRIDPEKLHVVYSGVELEQFHPRERERLRGAARAEIGCQPRDTLFLSMGPAIEPAIEALRAARNESFWLAAVTDQRGGSSGKVVFLGTREDARPLYAAADCLLLPGRYDPLPDSVLEALAMGVPGIVSARSGAAEAIEPGVNGWLCEPGDTADLVRRLAEADAAVRRGGMEQAARASAERFGSNATAAQVAGLYASF